MNITNPSGDDYKKTHELIGRLDGLVQHPVHFYKIVTQYFGDSFFVVKEAEELVGFVWGFISQTDRNLLFLWQIGLDESCRGKGLAGKLVERFIEFGRQNNCSRVHATVEPANRASSKLFEKSGFRNVSKGDTLVEHGKHAMKNYYGSGTNQILYEFKLLPDA